MKEDECAFFVSIKIRETAAFLNSFLFLKMKIRKCASIPSQGMMEKRKRKLNFLPFFCLMMMTDIHLSRYLESNTKGIFRKKMERQR